MAIQATRSANQKAWHYKLRDGFTKPGILQPSKSVAQIF